MLRLSGPAGGSCSCRGSSGGNNMGAANVHDKHNGSLVKSAHISVNKTEQNCGQNSSASFTNINSPLPPSIMERTKKALETSNGYSFIPAQINGMKETYLQKTNNNNNINNNNNSAQLSEYIVDPTTRTTYLKGKFLGKGGFARVYEFTDLTTSIVYAGKIIPKCRIIKPYHKEKIAREIDLHRTLKHEHIVRFHHFFTDDENVYIILENCSHKSLVHILKNRGKLSEPEVRYYLLQLILGVSYIHKKKIIHRDLKLGNMFLTEDLIMKIGDFGLATKVDENGHKKVTLCGTPNYIAPEVLKKQAHGYEADIWAVGCIMYAMLVGQPPFETTTMKETYARISNNNYAIPPLISVPARGLIIDLLQTDPKNRPEISSILSHEFFSSGFIPKTLPVSSCISLPKFPEDEHLGKSMKTVMESSAQNFISQEMRKISQIVPKLCMNGSKNEAKTIKDKSKLKNKFLSLKKDDTFCNVLRQKLNNVLCLDKTINKKTSFPSVTELFRVLSTFLNAVPSDPSLKSLTVCNIPVLFVTKWIDYSNKYGFGFQLCDRSVSILLNDSTKVSLTPDRSQIEFCESDGKRTLHCANTVPPGLQTHYTLLKYFAKYMDEKLTEGGKVRSPESLKRPCSVPYMHWWTRTATAILMQLSTGTVQVNFFKDHTKVILSKENDESFVTYIDESQQSTTYYFLQLAKFGCPSSLHQRLVYILGMLRDLSHLESTSV